jgi:hypothetical protein
LKKLPAFLLLKNQMEDFMEERFETLADWCEREDAYNSNKKEYLDQGLEYESILEPEFDSLARIELFEGEYWVNLYSIPHKRFIYDFRLNRITTQKDLLSWIWHLAGKSWVKSQTIANLIEVVCKHKKWNYHTL